MDNFKKIVKFVFNKKITILIIVFIFLLAVLLPSFVYYITIDDGTFKENDWKSTPYVASTYTGQAKITDDGITTQTSVKELWDEMIKKGNNVEQYLDKPEELEKLMNAEIITQYPKIGNEEVALDGVIEFERHKTDGTSTKLKYVNKKTFNNYIETKDVTNVMNSFTLDENGDILVGIIDKTTYELKSNDSDIDISNYTDNMNNSNKVSEGRFEKVEYNISSKTINYKNTIEKYSMPFQYLWALLVISDDKDFVLELADLVNDSEIIISIYDNISTTVNKSEYNYNKEIRMGTYAEVVPEQNYEVSGYPSKRYWVGEDSENYNPSYPADYITDEKIYNVECISTYENNTPIVSVSKANVWIGEYSKEYTYKKAEELKQENNNKQLEDTEYKEVENSSKNSYQDESLLNNQHALSLKEECRAFIQDKLNKMKTEENKKTLMINGAEINIDDIKVSVNVSYVQCNSYSHEINRTQSDTTLTSSQQYVEGNTVNNIKIEKNSEQPNFVTILSSKEHREAKRNILENSSWLFELLETNPDTVSMVDLTKYLLYKLTGNSYGVTDYDFSEYDASTMNDITIGTGASYESLNLTQSDIEILYKITSAERGNGTQQQQEYVVSVILNRVLSSKFPNTVYDVVFAKNQFQPTRNGAYEAANPSETTKAAVDNVVKNGDTAQFAVYFMTPAASLSQSWLSNCTFLFNDKDNGLRYSNTSGTHNFYTTQDIINELQQYSKSGSGTIVDSAVQIHKYVRENNYIYSQAGITLPNNKTKTIDCSSYVTWVLLNCNVNGFTKGMYQWTSVTFNSNPNGWQEVSVSEAKPGDILVYNGHVEIVAATGGDKFVVYNCGGNSSIKAQGLNGLPESSTSGRLKSTIKKILRVP